MFYVYKLIDPRTSLPFYVGKGKSKRSRVHFTPSAKGQNPYKDSVIRQIQERGQQVVIEHTSCETEQQAYDLERELIEQYGRRDLNTGILTNLQNGGEGAGSDRLLTLDTRRKLSVSKRGNNYNRNVPASGNGVVQMSLGGSEVASFTSALAAQRSTQIDSSQISWCCMGKYKTAGGYRWRYADPSSVVHHSKKCTQPVEQRTLGGDIVATYSSVSAAARAMGTGISYISRAATNGDTAFGFKWIKIKLFHTGT